MSESIDDLRRELRRLRDKEQAHAAAIAAAIERQMLEAEIRQVRAVLAAIGVTP